MANTPTEALNKLSLSASTSLGGITELETIHLDRFAKALHSANASKSRRDATLHSFFTKKK